jgi:hypothetical protein
VKIGKERILDAHFFGVGFVRPNAVNTDAEDFRVERVERPHVIDKARMLVGASRAPVQGIENQHDILLPGEIRELHFLFFLIHQGKVRRCLSNGNTHRFVLAFDSNRGKYLTQSAAEATISLRLTSLPLVPSRRYTTFYSPDYFMSPEATRRAPMMSLRDLVNIYRTHAGEFGKPVALSSFGLSDAETERMFSSYDEDYHISRFFHFSEAGGQKFSINGVPVTHVSLDAEIETLL